MDALPARCACGWAYSSRAMREADQAARGHVLRCRGTVTLPGWGSYRCRDGNLVTSRTRRLDPKPEAEAPKPEAEAASASPRTWCAGETVTAAMLNEHLHGELTARTERAVNCRNCGAPAEGEKCARCGSPR